MAHQQLVERLPLYCVCGPSATGKTTFSISLINRLKQLHYQPLLISCDDYYRSDWVPHPIFGFDTIDAIDVKALIADLLNAINAKAESLRVYDMATRLVTRRDVGFPYDLIIIEGSYGPQLFAECDFLTAIFYMRRPLIWRLFNRLKRDVFIRNRSPLYVCYQMIFQMLPAEMLFVNPLSDKADLILCDSYNSVQSVLEVIQKSCHVKKLHL